MTISTDPETIVNDAAPGFLSRLAPSLRCHPYQGRQDFLAFFEEEWQRYLADTSGHVDEWFLLDGVDRQTLNSEFLEPSDRNTPWTSWISYDEQLQLLLVRVTASIPHECASITFHTMLFEAIEDVGMKRTLRAIGGGAHFAALGAKQPDGAWRPHRLPRGRSQHWPSVVLEVAYSETQSKLLSDVRFWTRASSGDVKTVLTLHIHRQQPRITIEKWQRGVNGRHHLDQMVTIYKAANNRVITSGAPLVIGFEALFLRPASSPRERDIEVDEEKLRYLASEIWDEQGF